MGNYKSIKLLYVKKMEIENLAIEYKECIQDCNEAIYLDSKFFKAYARKAQALLILGEIDQAVNTYHMAYDVSGNENTFKKSTEEAEMIQKFKNELIECENNQ